MNEFPKWRPVTERPEVEDEYLVTVRSNLDLAGLSRRDRERRVLRYVCGQWLGYPDRFIVGWMPLPPECETQKDKEPGAAVWHDGNEEPEEPGAYFATVKIKVTEQLISCVATWTGKSWESRPFTNAKSSFGVALERDCGIAVMVAWLSAPEIPAKILLNH